MDVLLGIPPEATRAGRRDGTDDVLVAAFVFPGIDSFNDALVLTGFMFLALAVIVLAGLAWQRWFAGRIGHHHGGSHTTLACLQEAVNRWQRAPAILRVSKSPFHPYNRDG